MNGNSPKDIIYRLERGETNNHQSDYNNVLEYYRDKELMPEDVIGLYRLRSSLQNKEQIDISRVDNIVDEYFSYLIESGQVERLQRGVNESMSPDEIEDGLNSLENAWDDRLGEDYDAIGDGLLGIKKRYLLSVRQTLM